MTPRRPTDHCVIDAIAQVCRCLHCGETIPIPYGDVDWFCAVTKAFGAAHRSCKPGCAPANPKMPRCGFSIPVVP